MMAITKDRYGGPEILQLKQVEVPPLQTGHLLIKVMANSANPADWHILRGKPLFARLTTGLWTPKDAVLGADFAGIVEETGDEVTGFKKGDRVFGESLAGGAFAEYTSVPASVCAKIPDESSYKEMACLPIAGLTALQALVTHGKVKKGERVFINGASGGVGHFAVQIAKAYGAHVTAVCSARNLDFVKDLGADEVIAYDQENIHIHQGKYQLILDTHGNLFFRDFKRLGERGVVTGFTTLRHMLMVIIAKTLSKFHLVQFTAHANTKDLETLALLVKEKKISASIERTFTYQKIPEAISYIEAMRTRGKVAMIWEGNE